MFKNQRDQRNHRCHTRREVLAIVMLAAFLSSAFPFPAVASAPGEVTLSYDAGKRTLEIKITHPSKAPQRHYIEKVEISKNSSFVTQGEYKNQPDQATYSYTYTVDAAPGDVLEAKAICSILGSKTGKLTVR
jgi:desulfoferrodoxin (superoxide reductase-like protein)